MAARDLGPWEYTTDNGRIFVRRADKFLTAQEAAAGVPNVGGQSAAATAQADSYVGPIKVGNQCWVRQIGNSLGYWKTCDSGATAQAAVARSGKKK